MVEGVKMFCTSCGASNKDDARFCINCDESLSEVPIGEKALRLGMFKEVSILKKVDLLQSLFDFSFSQFVSPKIIRLLFGLSILFAALLAFFFVMVGFKASIWFGVFALLIGAPLTFLLMVSYSRVALELVLAIFRVVDHVDNIDGPARTEEKLESKDNIQWNV
jgi:hypothetical protein